RSGIDARPPRDNPRIHALERLEVGYNLSEVVEEYAILRRCIASIALRAPAVRSAEMKLLHQAIDQAISTSVVRYSAAHERTLRALDRISSTALKEHDVESLLPRLLDAFLETTASVDTVALSLRDGDGSLRVRAAVGYPPPGPVGERVPPAGAFSARVEREGTIFLRDASADPAISASPTCAPGTHALYGAPLTAADEILGVMVMGSRSTSEFSEEDQLLFRTMVNRAAALIAHARLRVEAERRAEESLRVQEELRAALEFRDRMLGVLSHDLRNPLGVILASAQVLERSVSEERQRRSLSRVISSARRIERMIRDLLD
ncbi:MAG TPA: histidine kinase dimerization/phospho-acceptor domain-containing protein, partial [Myxococcales bacterium]